MGLYTSHNCWHGSYSDFMVFRKSLAKLIDIDLDDYTEYGDYKKSLSELKHDIIPLLNHSDLDGELSVEESCSIALGLNTILIKHPELEVENKWLFDKITQFKNGCIIAILYDEIVEFD